MTAPATFKPHRLGRLFASDALNISRDPTLMFATAMSVVPAAAFWLWHGALDDAALAAFGVPQFSSYVAPVALVLPAFLVGWVTGFLMLEDRDDGALLAIDVTPVGKVGFLAYRLTITMAFAALITVVAARLIVADAGWPMALLFAALVAIEAACAAFVLPAIASNKVEGLAVTKVLNVAALVPLVAIVPAPWRYVGGIVPTYWVGELLGLSSASYLPVGAIVVLALASHAAAAMLLAALFARRSG